MSPTQRFRWQAFLLAAALLASALWADGAFTYQRTLNMSGGYGGQNTTFMEPSAIYVDGGMLYVSDRGASAVWVLDLSSDKAVDRIPSGAGSILSTPANIFISGGIVYIADPEQRQVVARIGSTNFIDVGPALSDQRQPVAVLVENQSLWVVDRARDQVLGYNLQTGRIMATLFGNGLGDASLNNPQDLAADDGHFYIADGGNNRVQAYDRAWNYLDTLGTGRGGVMLSNPSSVAAEGGRVYVADTDNRRVAVFNSDGYLLGSLNASTGGLPDLVPISVRASGNTLYVLDGANKSVRVYSMDWSAGAPQVLADLDALNRSAAAQQAVLDVMDKLGISHAPFGVPQALAQAQALAQNGQYLEASSRIAAARAELDAVGLQQAQAMRVGLQTRIDNLWGMFEPYRNLQVDNETDYRRTVVLNRIQTAQDRLNANDYTGSADLVLALQTDMAALIERINAWRSSHGEAAVPLASSMQAEMESQAANLSARLALLQLEAQAAGLNVSMDPYATLIDSGRQLARVGAYDDAKLTLAGAGARLDQLELQLNQTADMEAQVLNASATLTQAWAQVNSSLLAWQAAGIDAAPLQAQLEQARSLLPGQPGEAKQMALQVMESARLNDARAMTRNSAYGWLGLAIGAIAVVALAAWLLFRHRPKGGLGGV